ncbi:alpha/beta hydrolase fold protein [Stereum hirsutum FP-91666 SS1]|uniref:Alpha/beta hydrolase fold protein n=1 Tax=Stereum hirsutum (strain FP-91666) TaxID=721885 RepID=R7S005_STEHR|nr:alpha/beta hydrolase fold protein [Stereum hirsutum FP-91666 SS1]EIM80480.1 alpha/beta hydrolase fold protein [Stereum hirsutum FP-91666 SS1]
MSTSPAVQYYHHGRFKVSNGVIPDAVTAFKTYGNPENPCIVFPTCFGGKLARQDYMIGPEKALNPEKYYIVTLALFSNGESSSPSNTPTPYNGPYFPEVSYEDNIRAQHAVLTEHLSVKKVFCVVGFSMGAQQAYYWPVMYPEMVERFVVLCGSARTSPHNQCFIEGPKIALVSSKDFENGHYKTTPQHGIRAFARVYSAWAYGQTWYRNKQYLYDGMYPDLNSFIRGNWEARFLDAWDANDMITLINTWQQGDVSLIRHGGDLEKCLSEITAKGLIMPSKTDLYFPPEDSENEVSWMRNGAELAVIDTVWGHLAGGGANSKDDEFIKSKILHFFKSTA